MIAIVNCALSVAMVPLSVGVGWLARFEETLKATGFRNFIIVKRTLETDAVGGTCNPEV